MRGTSKTVSHTAPAVTLALLSLAATPAQAQSLNNWSLQPSSPGSSTPGAEGPVDAQNPVVRPAAPATPDTPGASTVPTINAPPPPSRATARARATPQPMATASPTSAPASGSTGPAPQQAPPTPVAASTPSMDAEPAPVPAAVAPPTTPATPAGRSMPSPATNDWPIWWWAAPALLAALALGFLLARRRSTASEEAWEEPQQDSLTIAPPPAPLQSAAPVAVAPIPAPALGTSSMPATAAPERLRARGQVDFQPVTLRLSLVYATLRFRLLLTAQTEIPEGRLLGDMISAHGSLPQAMQLRPPPETLALLQAIPRLAPGQVLEVKGDIRLPLNAIRPLQQGKAAFMVPLVRLALLGNGEASSPHLELGCVFTVGVPGNGPAFAPLRLDTGPRDYTTLAAREIEGARRTSLFALDPARAAG